MYEYEERVIAYIDVIGWKNETKRDLVSDSVKRIIKYFKEQYDSRSNKFEIDVDKQVSENKNLKKINRYFEVQCAIFSDNILISMPAFFESEIFIKAAEIFEKLLKEGFLSRGGVSIGPLYHKENIVFGPALNEVVELEQEAKYPRILCSNAIIEHALSWNINPEPNRIFDDCLGRKIVNPFPKIHSGCSDQRNSHENISPIHK